MPQTFVGKFGCLWAEREVRNDYEILNKKLKNIITGLNGFNDK